MEFNLNIQLAPILDDRVLDPQLCFGDRGIACSARAIGRIRRITCIPVVIGLNSFFDTKILTKTPSVHHADRVGYRADLFHTMRNKDYRALIDELVDPVVALMPKRGIPHRQHFVKKEDIRL